MSSSSREYSPDWLRNVQAPPTTSILTLSSSSDDDQLPISSVVNNTSQPSIKRNRLGETEGNKGDRKAAKNTKSQEPKRSVWKFPSDSEHELSEGQHPNTEDDEAEETSLKRASKLESSKKRLPAEIKGENMTDQENDDDKDDDLKVLERETTDEKQTGPYVIKNDKLSNVVVLVECEGDSIDLSGDLGSVGRVVISDSPCGDQDMLLDLKGTIYKTIIMPSRTLCVVSSHKLIEAIMNDFIQLMPQSNVYEAETMVEVGTLEGFLFNSEDEGDTHANRQTDENEGGEPQANGKSRGKSEAAKKKGKTAVKKPTSKKFNKKKAPVAKKTKAKR
ncbi:hypothetical protein E3N88_03664 [Mikania micrantha]|uniref:DNA-binding protein BIN4 n=1 Tax=Mikania micrantha TaxID=192012 RepID=A0A5N6Q9I6_9ASTR|nr:hypothetical protein E3N88_03664 [Mikania micrantha]